MNEILLIEICKGYKEMTLNMRIGDIRGSIETGNINKEEILRTISEELDNILKGDIKNE